MLVCTLGGEGGGGLKKCTLCTLMKMLTFLDGPLPVQVFDIKLLQCHKDHNRIMPPL